MVIYQITSPTTVAIFIADKLENKLSAGKKGLWLVPGGSAITIAVQVSKLLRKNNFLNNLNVTLTDERYGPVGHPESNWQQLLDAGFDLPKARLFPVLNGQDAAATAEKYSQTLQELLANNDYKLGFFGMGSDGHTAGMLPGSPAANETDSLAVQYIGPDHHRITLTPPAIYQLDTAVMYAVGVEKVPKLTQLKDKVSVAKQPAQALKQVKEFYIFTDSRLDSPKTSQYSGVSRSDSDTVLSAGGVPEGTQTTEKQNVDTSGKSGAAGILGESSKGV